MDCPDQNSKEWKDLKDGLGTDGATEAYVGNDGKIPKDTSEFFKGEYNQDFSHGNEAPTKSIEQEAYYSNQFLTRNHTSSENKVYDLNRAESTNLLKHKLHELGVFEFMVNDMFNEEAVIDAKGNFHASVKEMIKQLVGQDVYETTLDGERMKKEYRNTILPQELSALDEWAGNATNEEVQKLLDYLKAIEMNELGKIPSLAIDPNQRNMFDTMIKIAVRLNKLSEINDSLLHEGQSYSAEILTEESFEEIEKVFDHRQAVLDRLDNTMVGQYVPLSKMVKWIEKQASHITNARVLGKFLTGSDKSNFTNVIWKQMYKASGKMFALQNEFKNIVRVESKDYLKSISHYNNPLAKLDEMDTVEYGFVTGGKPVTVGDVKHIDGGVKENIKLTQAEEISLYMNLREQKGDDTDPRHALLEENVGMFLRDSLGGRKDRKKIYLGATYADRLKLANQIKQNVESDPKKMDIVNKIDTAINKRHKDINGTYSQLMGWNLQKINNFFPARYGKKTENVKMAHMSVQKLSTIIDRSGNKNHAVQIGDVFEVLDSYNLSSSHYTAFSIPVRNADMLYNKLKRRMDDAGMDALDPMFKKIKTFITYNEDPGTLFKAEGEKAFEQAFNKFNNTFAVAVLGWNIPVMLKQTASYQLARECIDGKYLQQAGWGAGGQFVGIKPGFVVQSLLKGKKIAGIPVAWRADESNPSYVEMMENSDILSARFGGFISREMGEYAMGGKFGNDKLRIKIKGKTYEIDRQRFMEGIKIFDSATVIAIWDAVKLEVEAETNLTKGSPEYWTRVTERTEEIVAKSQPTFDNANRMEVSLYRNPVARMFTMFTSATSKIAQLNYEAVMDFVNEPTPENRKRLRKRLLNTTFGVGTWIAGINLLRSMVFLGADDEEEVLTAGNYMDEIWKSAFAQFPILREVYAGMVSQMDDKFWNDDMQVPMLEYYNKGLDTFGSAYKWIWEGKDKGVQTYNNTLDLFAIGKGLPVFATRFLKGET